ncbi:MAG TPA: helix-turn-helix domain-containing protein [Paraburkholderia sp.]
MAEGVIKTAQRVFEVLEYFRDVRRPLAVREVSAHCRYPLSSTAVLLKSMATLGYLAYDGALKAYFPTMQMAALGDWVLESMFARGEVFELAEAIHQQCGETVIVGVQNDVFVHYAHVIPSQHPLRFFTPVGTRRTLCLSGLGWAILSTQSDDTIRQQIARTITRLGRTAKPINDEYVFEQVEHVRKHGYALSRGTITRGASVIAIPLRMGGIDTRIGIAIGGPIERLDPEVPRLLELMRRQLDKFSLEKPR